MSSTVDAIVSFLRGKGLSDPAIAGILGNLQVESNDSTTAYNPNEGAIGLAQWEGGRRTALQAYARAHGGTETDLNMQLGYMWQELSSSESGVLSQLRSVSTASEAARIWDTQYERSDGTTDAQRQADAANYLVNGLQGGGSGGGTDAQYADYQSSGSGSQPNDQYTQDLGPLAGALTAIPELARLLQQAEAGNWTVGRFENAVENSDWYRTNSDSIRQGIALQQSDPATYQQNLNQEIAHVHQMALQLGVNLSTAQLNALGTSAYLQGLDDATISAQVGAYYGQNGSSADGGRSVSLTQQLQQLAGQYGVPVTQQWINRWVQQDLVSGNGVEGATADLERQATSMYPGLAQQIKNGQTVMDVAQPYVATMSNLLEMPETQVKLQTPLIQQALQYKDPTSNVAQPLPLWQFQDKVRLDPRWDKTDNARQTAYTMLNQIGSDWGFAS